MSQLLLMNTDKCHLLVTNHDEDVSITVDEYRYNVIFSLLITMKMSQLLLMNTIDEYRYMSSSRY